jgi:hypothetical protein
MPLGGESAISNTLGKLWTERINYFASVEFNKVSVLTGIVKICLKTLLESVRLRTFGKYGLQQVQVRISIDDAEEYAVVYIFRWTVTTCNCTCGVSCSMSTWCIVYWTRSSRAPSIAASTHR